MSKKTNVKSDAGRSKDDSTAYFKSTEGDSLAVTISRSGLVTIWAVKIDRRSTLGSIVVSELSPEKTSKKSKGFWRKLWGKVKKVVGDVIEVVTFPAGPLTCRPSAQDGFQDVKLISLKCWRKL